MYSGFFFFQVTHCFFGRTQGQTGGSRQQPGEAERKHPVFWAIKAHLWSSKHARLRFPKRLVEMHCPGGAGLPLSQHAQGFLCAKQNGILDQLSAKRCSNLGEKQTFQISSLFFIKPFHGHLWVKLCIPFTLGVVLLFRVRRNRTHPISWLNLWVKQSSYKPWTSLLLSHIFVPHQKEKVSAIYTQGRCLISFPARWGCWWVTLSQPGGLKPKPPQRGRRGAELCPEHSDCAATTFGSGISLCHYTKSMGLNSAICSPGLVESVEITWNYLIMCRLTNNSRHCSPGWTGARPFLSLPEEWELCPANNKHCKFLLPKNELDFLF